MEKTVNTRLHTYISLLLAEKHISQAELAVKMGTSPQMVNYIISGRRRSATLELKLAQALGYDNFDQIYESAAVFFDWFGSRVFERRPEQRNAV